MTRMRSSENVPADIRSLCERWGNGRHSQMRMIVQRRPFSTQRLLTEIDRAMIDPSERHEHERHQLEHLQKWAIREDSLAEAQAQLDHAVFLARRQNADDAQIRNMVEMSLRVLVVSSD